MGVSQGRAGRLTAARTPATDLPQTVGRRERKKAATRQALADAALELFLDRGFDKVGVREIAEAADVSTATLFKHFPTKESLVFDQDAEREAALVAAVRDRASGQSVFAALRDYLRGAVTAMRSDDSRLADYLALVQQSETLREYSRRMWLRHEKALAQAIFDEVDGTADITTCAALAHFALESQNMLHGEAQPLAVFDHIFALLENGWNGFRGPHPPGTDSDSDQ
jgi:AcrR family transcriptional regulator